MKKIIVRIDDVGYTNINNMGAFEVFDNGIGTAADVMLDTPGTADALQRLKNYPWLSIGWHTHFWGSPVLGAYKVPTLVDPKTGHFRQDLSRLTEGVSYDELIREMRAQIELCLSILGKTPDTAGVMGPQDTIFNRAKRQIVEEYGMITDFTYRANRDPETGKFTVTEPADKRWAAGKVFWMGPGPAYQDLQTDSIKAMAAYDPVKYYTEDRGHTAELPEDGVYGQAWHPGYVDYYMCRLGDHGPQARNFIECRPLDMHALCSDEIKAWIRENKVMLMSFTDALYGRQDYQNHLRNIGSDLCMLDRK